jgi:hypothetical protein
MPPMFVTTARIAPSNRAPRVWHVFDRPGEKKTCRGDLCRSRHHGRDQSHLVDWRAQQTGPRRFASGLLRGMSPANSLAGLLLSPEAMKIHDGRGGAVRCGRCGKVWARCASRDFANIALPPGARPLRMCRSRSSARLGAVGDCGGCEEGVARSARAHFTHVLPHGPQLAEWIARHLIARGEESQLPAATNDQCTGRWIARTGRGLVWAASGLCAMCVRAHCAHALPHGPQLAEWIARHLIARGEESQLPAATNDQCTGRWIARTGRGLVWAASGLCAMCVRAHCAHALPHGPQLAGRRITGVLIARGEDNQSPGRPGSAAAHQTHLSQHVASSSDWSDAVVPDARLGRYQRRSLPGKHTRFIPTIKTSFFQPSITISPAVLMYGQNV